MYRPSRPERIDNFLRSYTRRKTPHFFKYVKNKNDSQVEPLNNSIVNKLEKLIKNKRLSFKHLMDFDYKILMRDPHAQIYEGVVAYFIEEKQTYHNDVRQKRGPDDDSNIEYLRNKIRIKMRKTGFDDDEISDILVEYSYGVADDRYKKLLWLVYGDIILENIKNNLGDIDPYCMKCGKRFKKRSNHHKFCDDCANQNIYKVRKVICQDCGKEFEVPLTSRRTKRCEECQKAHRRETIRLSVQKHRAMSP